MTGVLIKETFSMVKKMEKEHFNKKMVSGMKDNGKMVGNMELVDLHKKTEL